MTSARAVADDVEFVINMQLQYIVSSKLRFENDLFFLKGENCSGQMTENSGTSFLKLILYPTQRLSTELGEERKI